MTAMKDTIKTAGTILLAYPPSLLLMLGVGNWLPIVGGNAPGCLSLVAVLEFWGLAALVCLPSLILLILFAPSKPLKQASLLTTSLVLMVVSFIPWFAFALLLRDLD